MIKEINFSKKAVERINKLISKKPSGTFFRIAVKGGGCSGFKYDFSFDSSIEDTDLRHENIIVDKKPKPTTDNKMSTYEKIKIAKFGNIL